MPESKIIALARKIQALADSGEGGEKMNAQQMLKELMQKHGITEAMLEADSAEMRGFNSLSETRFILVQCLFVVLGEDGSIYEGKEDKCMLYAKCTRAEQLEIVARYKFYVSEWAFTLQVTQHAFIMKNALYPAGITLKKSQSQTDIVKVQSIQEALQYVEGRPFNKPLNQQ